LLDGGVFEGVLHRAAIEGIVREHTRGDEDHTSKLGCLLSFEGWLQSVKPD
jgi:hypothetical protein